MKRDKTGALSIGLTMDKLQLTGQSLGRVFNSRSDYLSAMHLFFYEPRQLNLKFKIQPKQLLGYFPLAFGLPALTILGELANPDKTKSKPALAEVPRRPRALSRLKPSILDFLT